jgi:hypothetical protein
MVKRKPEAGDGKATEATNGEPVLVQSSKPLVFISHDSRDAKLAEAFSNLLTDASGGNLKSFRSSDKKGNTGIEYGSEWYSAIMVALKQSTDVVALLTKHSLDRPWILFEAGVAKGRNDTVAFGVTLGIPLTQATTSGPFGQFQNCGDDEESLTGLVMQLIRRIPDATPREEAIRRQVQAFRTSVGELLKQPKADENKVDETTVAKLFEEVKVLFRDLPQQVEKKLAEMRPEHLRRRRRNRFHPAMVEDLLLGSRFGKNSEATAWLMFVSLFRDDAPWLYEIGMEVYRALRAGDIKKLNEARKDFEDVSMALRHGHPAILEMMDPDREDAFMMLQHLPKMADDFLYRLRARLATKEPGEEKAVAAPEKKEKK